MRILEPLARRQSLPATTEQRFLGLDQLLLSYQGQQYFMNPMSGSRPDVPDMSFRGFVDGVHRRHGVVPAAVVARALLLSGLRFCYRRDRFAGDRAGEIFVDRSLRVLDRPGSATRSEMLFAAELDVSYSGTAYLVRDGNTIRRLIPDHCSVLLASDSDPDWDGTDTLRVPYDAEVQALVYHPQRGASGIGSNVTIFLPGEFVIWKPEPDPINFWRGASWVTSVLREVVSDDQATDHQQKFFERAATPNVVVMMDPAKSPAEVAEFADVFNSRFSGSQNAYKNWFLGGGTDVKVIGSTLESLNLKDLTGGFETRIASRSRVPGVVLGIREGYGGSSLNTGNYGAARRLFADGWFAPTAESLCQALEAIVPPPRNSELWYDRSEILFLQEDMKDAADIAATQATAIRQLIDGGYEPGSVAIAVSTGDMTKLQHTGNLSVQLQPPGTTGTPADGGGRMAQLDWMMERMADHPRSGNEVRVQIPEVIVQPVVNLGELPTPEVTVNVPPAEVVVNVATPEVNVTVPTPEVNVTVPPAETMPAPEVVVNLAPSDAPPVNVVVEVPRSRHRVRRDANGNIVEIIEEPAP